MATLQPHDVAYNLNRVEELLREQTVKLPKVDQNGQPINDKQEQQG